MKKIIYGAIGIVLATQAHGTNAALSFKKGNEVDLGGTTASADQAIITLITTISTFAMLIAVLYAIFGGFTILTAAGDEEKVKKGRTVIFHAILGLIVIYLAYSIILWVMNLFIGGGGQ